MAYTLIKKVRERNLDFDRFSTLQNCFKRNIENDLRRKTKKILYYYVTFSSQKSLKLHNITYLVCLILDAPENREIPNSGASGLERRFQPGGCVSHFFH